MKNAIFIGLFLIVTVFSYAQNGTVEVVCENLTPYFTETLSDDGIMGSIVREAFKNAGYQVHFNYVPYARALLYFKEGKYPLHLGTSTVFQNDPISDKIISESLFNVTWRFFTYDKPMPKYTSLKDLKGYKIGTYIGSIENDILISNDITPEAKTSMDTLVQMLKINRLDLVSILDVAFVQKARELFPTEYQKFAQSKPIITVDASVMFTKTNPEGEKLSNIFKFEVAKLIKNGFVLRSLERYYGKGNVPEDVYKQ